MKSVIGELRRRNVLRVAAAYAVGAWIVIEAGSVLLPTFGAPEWFFRVWVMLVAGGFVLALVIAWVFELTPEGIRRERDVDRSRSIAKDTGRRLNYSIIAMLVVALSISVFLNVMGLRHGSSAGAAGEASLAVLPFESRSMESGNEILTDGIHDDLLTNLANVEALKVISRTSVMEYRGQARNLREIGEKLGVAHVLEGSVQREGDQVRINVQLIDARSDEHIWARIYDRALTAKNLFQIQSEIAAEITEALRAQLTPAEQQRIVSVPTQNLDAYRLYTAGRRNLYERRLDTIRRAREQFEEAIELDPAYSQAYSGLADSILLLFINHNALSPTEAYQQAEAALENALTLNDQNADAYASLGLLEMNRAINNSSTAGLAEAEAAFRRAIELSPNHAQAYAWYASLKASQTDFDDAIELYGKALALDPLARVARSNLAQLFAQTGRNDAALAEWLETVRFNPDWPNPYENIASHLAGLGRLEEGYAWSARARELSADPIMGQTMVAVLFQFGDVERAAGFLDLIPADHPLFSIVPGFLAQVRRDYDGALVAWEKALEPGSVPVQFMLDPMSDAAAIIGQLDKAMEYCLRQNPRLPDADFEVDELNAHNALKYAWLLQQEDPADPRAAVLLDETLAVVAGMPRLGSAGHGIRDVQALALQGRRDKALTRLQQAFDEGFRAPRLFDNWYFQDDPYLAPIRDTAEFRAIAAAIDADIVDMRQRLDAAIAADDLQSLRDRVAGMMRADNI